MDLKETLGIDWDKDLVTSEFCIERDGFLLWGTEYRRKFPRHRKQTPVILSHGFMGNQKGAEVYARHLAMWGCAAYTFDFIGGNRGGKSEGSIAKDMTLWTEVEDLKRVIGYVCGLSYVDANKLILLGGSQGAVVSAIVAAQMPKKVKQLILLYPALCIADDCRRGENMFFHYDPDDIPDQIPAQLPNPILEKLAGDKLPVLNGDYCRTMMDVDLFKEIDGYHGRVLIIHGTDDKVVGYSYGRKAYQQYKAARQEKLRVHALKTSGIKGAALRDIPDPGCHLVLIEHAGHGFFGEYRRMAIQEMKHFLLREAEVLTVDVHLGDQKIVSMGLDNTVRVEFTGEAKSEFFTGEVKPGAYDLQNRRGTVPQLFEADYTLDGRDYTGEECEIHITNRYDGKIWKPEISTDSRALDFLNHAEASAYLEQHKSGPVVRIYVAQRDLTGI